MDSKGVRIVGVLVTYRRTSLLADTLEKISNQTRQLDQILVVDNENSTATRDLVDGFAQTFPTCLRYEATPRNLGSAGGWAFGMEQFQAAKNFDWIMPLDDDDPPEDDCDFERMIDFALLAKDDMPKLAAVGIVGARFDWRKGLIQRVPDDELEGRVSVDFVGSGYTPLYHHDAFSQVGVFDASLFFGYTEVEYGLRLKQAGLEIVANAEIWRERREAKGRLGVQFKPKKVCVISSRKYYAIRNHIYIMCKHRRWDLAAKQVAIQCFAKPLYTLFTKPGRAVAGAIQAVAASRDGFLGRMGMRRELTAQQRDTFEVVMSDEVATEEVSSAREEVSG